MARHELDHLVSGKAPRKQLAAKSQARKTEPGNSSWWCEEAASFQARNCRSPRDSSVPEVDGGCFIRKLPFQRLVREIAQDFKVCLCV